jgi:hypothetical protein
VTPSAEGEKVRGIAMSKTRTFHVTQEYTEYYTVTWEVEAESFDEANDMVQDGYAEEYDRDFEDSEYGSIDDVTCQDCYETEYRCECESEAAAQSEQFFAEIGL